MHSETVLFDRPQLRPTVIVREATCGERPALNELPMWGDQRWRQLCCQQIQLVATINGVTAGFILIFPGRMRAGLTVWLPEQYRIPTVKWALANAAINAARRRGFRSLWTFVTADDGPARAELLSLGFHIEGESAGQLQLGLSFGL